MGNCCSEVAGGREAVGGRAAAAGNDAVNHFLKSRGMYGSQMEVGRSSIGFVVSTVHKYDLELLSVDNYGWKL